MQVFWRRPYRLSKETENTHIDDNKLGGRGVAKPEAVDIRAWNGRDDVRGELMLLAIARMHALEWGHDSL